MQIAILGSTGSIGKSTLEVVRQNHEDLKIVLLSANKSTELLLNQCLEFKPKYVYIEDDDSKIRLRKELEEKKTETQFIGKYEDLESLILANEFETIVAATVGIAGLRPVVAGVSSGKRILLANKESYVVAGEYLNNLCSKYGSEIFPLDSEHSAIFQCLNGNNQTQDVSRIILTGSGGPFLKEAKDKLQDVSIEQALAHPVWKMGKKISIDSATMMNKGLEIIEAYWLFGEKNIEVLIHPEGIIHSMVEYKDMSVIAQLSEPDMKIPISFGLGYPKRIDSGSSRLELTKIGALNFFQPDYDKFPCLGIAQETLKVGGSSFTNLNASNEVCVDAFLNNKIGFTDIPKIISKILDKIEVFPVKSIEDVFEADKVARKLTSDLII